MTLFKGSTRAFDQGYFLSSNQFIPTRPPFSTAGVPITPLNAITKVPLFQAVNLVATMPQMMDAGVWTGQGGDRRKVRMPGNIEDPEGEGYGLADFAYKYLSQRMLRGNVFIRVNNVDSQGRPDTVRILNPDQVVVKFDVKTGQFQFFDSLTGAHMRPFPHGQAAGGLIHRRAFPVPGQVLGLSVVANHARTLGLSLASEQFGADFFGDGAHPSGILSTDQPMPEEAARTVKTRFVNAIRGSREPAVLGAGLKYQQIQIAPQESQFLDTQKFTAAELCRMVGPGVAEMLGYETGGKLTYQNVQSRSLHLLIYTVDKWMKDLEHCLSTMFVARSQDVEFDREGIMRMTPDSRWQMYEVMIEQGTVTINEIRALEGLPPVPWGDEPFLPGFGRTGTAAAEEEQINAVKAGINPHAAPSPPKIAGVQEKAQ